MRIKGDGASSFGGGGARQGSERSERFRKGHRPGQKVRGVIVEWRTEELAWVEIDGHGLLARVSRDSLLGRERTFLIVRLTPEIMLRELTDKPQGFSAVV